MSTGRSSLDALVKAVEQQQEEHSSADNSSTHPSNSSVSNTVIVSQNDKVLPSTITQSSVLPSINAQVPQGFLTYPHAFTTSAANLGGQIGHGTYFDFGHSILPNSVSQTNPHDTLLPLPPLSALPLDRNMLRCSDIQVSYYTRQPQQTTQIQRHQRTQSQPISWTPAHRGLLAAPTNSTEPQQDDQAHKKELARARAVEAQRLARLEAREELIAQAKAEILRQRRASESNASKFRVIEGPPHKSHRIKSLPVVIGEYKTVVEPLRQDNGRYKCSLCERTFKHAKHVRRHGLNHSDVRLFECSTCHSTFNRNDSLARHQLRCGLPRTVVVREFDPSVERAKEGLSKPSLRRYSSISDSAESRSPLGGSNDEEDYDVTETPRSDADELEPKDIQRNTALSTVTSERFIRGNNSRLTKTGCHVSTYASPSASEILSTVLSEDDRIPNAISTSASVA